MEKEDAGPVAAAYRELEEELNIPQNQVEFIGSVGHFQTVLRPKDVEAFIGLWDTEGPIRYDSKEIARILEIPLNRIVQTHKQRNFHNRIPDTNDLTYPVEDVVIWGVTARILHHLIEMLYPWLNDKGEFCL
jgi:8-oxo-dGTP pyrophosphatase MutT (NUDIX family)